MNPMEEPIDFTELRKVFPDGAVQTQVLLDFRSYIRTDHAKLIEMLEKNDANKVERAAHRMNGSSSMVGAKQLAKACAAIEQSARKKDMAGVKAVMASLDEAIKQLENFLSTLEVKYQSTIDQE
jgi:HPt (histidine-containing phosphotransfer) domain-containing protein